MKVSKKISVLALSLGLAAATGACGGKDSKDDDDDADTAGVPAGNGGGGTTAQTGSLALNVSAVSSTSAALLLSAAKTKSFTPVSYKLPIARIYASTEASSATGTQTGDGESLYKCDSDAEADCMLDLLDTAGLKEKLGASVKIPVGTYKSVGYAMACGTVDAATNADGKGIHVYVKGTMTIDGTVYYTTDGTDVLTTDQTKYAAAKLAMGGCGGKVYNLPTDLTVEADKEYVLNLFLGSESMAWASTDGGAGNPAGCVYSGTAAAPANGICTNIPAIVPAVGSFTPKLETYLVSSPTYCGNARLQLVTDSAGGDPIGVFLNREYDGANDASACWDAGADLLEKNADGTYTIGADTTGGAVNPRVKFDAFKRETHTGELSHDQSGTLKTGEAYTATKQ